MFTTLGVMLLMVSLLANVYLLMFTGLFSAQGTPFVQTTVVEGDAQEKVAIIPVEGLIDQSMSALVGRMLDMAEKDNAVKALVVKVETPGGAVTASDEIRHRLEKLRQKKRERLGNFPVVVSMGGLGTSGGYYLSCEADHIVAQPTTLTGNIGVLMPRFNLSEFMQRHGVSERTLAAPPDGYKNAGSMFSPENPKDVKYLQGIADQAYERFKDLVEKGRSGKLKAPLAEVANGKVYTAQEAKANGLIDEIGYLEEACSAAARIAGLSRPTIVRYQRRPSLLEFLAAGGSGQQPGAVNIHVRLDATMLDELSTPRLLYLWRGD